MSELRSCKKIILGDDGSESSKYALARAALLESQAGARCESSWSWR